jgi:hypothetical protein
MFKIGLFSLVISSTNSISYLPNIDGTMNFDIVSANVFPRQTLFPPEKGTKQNGFLFLPLGVR